MILDFIYVAGALLIFLGVPGLISAYAEDRPLRYTTALLVLGVLLMGAVWWTAPDTYGPSGFARAIYRVMGHVLHNFH